MDMEFHEKLFGIWDDMKNYINTILNNTAFFHASSILEYNVE